MSARDYLEKDYYKTLGVPKDAKPDEIKKAYRKLARTHHPDANKGDPAAEERFKGISEAYDVLADEKRRKEYDEGRSLFGTGGFRAPGRGTSTGSGGYTFDVGDLFGQGGAGGGLGDILGGLFGGRGAGRTTAPRRGADVETEVTLPFSDAVEGATVSLRLASEAACPTCHGTGAKGGTMPRQCPVCLGTGQTTRNQGGFGFSEPCRECRGRGLVVDDPCPDCHGSGRATGTRTLNARIPAGVRDGQRIRLKGKGAPGERGGPAGDLFVNVHVRPHPLFGRKADNLTLTVPVTFAEAALGAQIKVPTLGGPPVTLKLPAGTANGRTFRVKGKGVRRKDGTMGDLLVTVDVAVPGKLSAKAREAVEAFQNATSGEDPRAGLFDQGRG
ncbi:MAG: molecular chaperone DnaJ [Actinomycetota bacterium]|jgi:molecular chaperone DnaJ|nr:molecular chaperone DnaJ [Actinomycetota bacterium]